ncbi:MAG: UDP-N-acetyl-alpha-D-muramoyl-L-alanyl-L-glutamate epimerase [Rudaea sp.]
MSSVDPRSALAFRFISSSFDAATATVSLCYAFDDGDELVERIVFTGAPALAPERTSAFAAALRLLHLVAGVSYYKAGVPAQILIEAAPFDADTAGFVEQVYQHGLAEFAYQNAFHDIGIDLRERIRFPSVDTSPLAPAASLGLPRRTLLPIGGGKDSLVSVERCRAIAEPATAVWIGDSALIAACAERTGLPQLNIRRMLAPGLFELNRTGAWNGHVPVTAINSVVLVCAAILYGYDAIAFSNERSASSATLEYDGQEINHQWSKGFAFELRLRAYVHAHIAADLDYFSLLRPWSELAVARAFARSSAYDDVFSSCNRNFRILGAHPTDRWCGKCPKCHFVFLALAPFVAKPRLLRIFGRNLLDDASLAPGFDALLEYRDHKPFECVGEGRESRAALFALSERAEWREDALVARFATQILPQLVAGDAAIAPLLAPAAEHCLPARFAAQLAAAG